eukprot:CCRYP_018498-RB/>CCRYP_018498-RB protein AED:0.40 eAED:0.40 QI:216/0.6/0.66/1/1/1/6/0/631
MPLWEGIEDASTMLPRIWLTRAKDGDVWKPLRKIDCKALNESRGEEVLIEGGRATADPKNGTIRFNFVNRPPTKLMPATWFTKEEKSSKEFVLQPLPEVDSWQVELLYQNAVQASSALGEGIDDILKEEVILESDPGFKVVVWRAGSVLSMKKRPKTSRLFSFGEVQHTLQRGYGQYTIEGEDDENALGPVTHAVFVIHGIGEAMWAKEEVNMMTTYDELNLLRATFNKKKVASWRDECKKCEKQKQKLPEPPNRVEFIPIEWYDKVRSPSHALMTSLNAVTLRSIPALRSIANDVIFDVLMYLTPEFCGALQHFSEDPSNVYSERGKFSLIGHSLGSVIAWDVLSILKDNIEKGAPQGSAEDPIVLDAPVSPHRAPSLTSLDKGVADNSIGYKAYAKGSESDSKHGTWGPCLPKKMTRTIPFIPEITVFLGSPVGLFLTLRGAHSVFDEMRAVAEAERASLIPCDNDEADPPPVFNVTPIICSPFSLPTKALYNIFHPSPDGKSVRLHVKARQVGDQLFRNLGSISNMFDKSIEHAAAAAAAADAEAARKLGNTEASKGDTKAQRPIFEGCIKDREMSFKLGGKTHRVDFQIQPGVIDNEYLSAVTAHSSYFCNDDVIDFLIVNTRTNEA